VVLLEKEDCDKACIPNPLYVEFGEGDCSQVSIEDIIQTALRDHVRAHVKKPPKLTK